MRDISEDLIKTHADRRFRSEYDYALFEYYRSAKVLSFLDRAGVQVRGRVLDAGCGGGGMPLSLALVSTMRKVSPLSRSPSLRIGISINLKCSPGWKVNRLETEV